MSKNPSDKTYKNFFIPDDTPKMYLDGVETDYITIYNYSFAEEGSPQYPIVVLPFPHYEGQELTIEVLGQYSINLYIADSSEFHWFDGNVLQLAPSGIGPLKLLYMPVNTKVNLRCDGVNWGVISVKDIPNTGVSTYENILLLTGPM